MEQSAYGQPSTSMYDVKMDSLKNLVNDKLTHHGLYEQINAMTSLDNADEQLIMKKIKESGLIEDIMNSLKTVDKASPQLVMDKTIEVNQSPSQPCLLLKLTQGRDFIDYNPKTIHSEAPIYFQFDISFFGQRFHSKKVPTANEFIIDETFLLDFNPLKLDLELSFSFLKTISNPIHIVILLIEGEETKIVATKSIEWRWALCYGNWRVETEFKSPSSLNSINVGMVEMGVYLVPMLDKTKLLSQATITDRLNDERKNEVEKTQDFIQFASEWWEDYKTIRSSHANRLVKLFIPTEDREMYVYKPANCLVEAISVGRALNTPYEAARFVSLIPYERRENPGGEKVEIWHSMHTFLSVMKGDVEDHVVLLCNLLLGFGLDAYIASGVAINGPHLWVLTRNKVSNTKYQVTYWESLTGQRISVEDQKVFRFYKRIHCVFSDCRFYANVQIDDSVFNSSYVFEDDTLWKTIPNDKIAQLPKYTISPILDIITIDKYKLEIDIEKSLKGKVAKFRKTLDIKTAWDGKMSHLISPALVNYEMERISNQTYGNEEFKSSVKSYVPEGFTFKAYPFQTSDLDVDKMFGCILTNEIGKDILNTRGDMVTFAIRCKIYPYPQGVYSVWIMLATKYRMIK